MTLIPGRTANTSIRLPADWANESKALLPTSVKVKVQDTFPPDIPGNLVVFTAKDQIFLTWETVPDVDLAFYRVYRKSF